MQIGRKISNKCRLPALRLKVDKAKCIDCKKCTRNCPMSLEVNQMIQNEDMENMECVLCGSCVDGCPKKVISYTFGRSI